MADSDLFGRRMDALGAGRYGRAMGIRSFRFGLAFGAALLAVSLAHAGYDEGVAAIHKGQYAVALDEWTKAAQAGDARAQYGLGYLYQFGLGTDPDNSQALDWYQKAAAQKEPDALFALGLMFESGRAGKRDIPKALALYRQAAETGHSPESEYALGRVYLRGQGGVARDEKEAFIWIDKAAHEGQPGAQYLLGEAYETGGLYKADKLQAYYWYSAALAGDPAVLHATDPEFDPKAALDVLSARMTRWEIEDAKALLKKTPPPQPAPAAMMAAAPAPVAAPAAASVPLSGSMPMSGTGSGTSPATAKPAAPAMPLSPAMPMSRALTAPGQ